MEAEAEADFLEGIHSPRFYIVKVWRLTSHARVLNTVNDTTKGLPVVGQVTDPVLQTVGGVTDGLPIVRPRSSSLVPVIVPSTSPRSYRTTFTIALY